MDKEILKGSLDIILLTLLIKKDMYGYEIGKVIKNLTSSTYELGEGTLYPALKRLEDRGFLNSYWENTGTEQKRKYYKITKDGTLELKAKLDSWRLLTSIIEKSLIEGVITNE